jgi:hypothetical protein
LGLLRLRQLADSRNDPKFYEFRLNPFPKLITATVIAREAKQSPQHNLIYGRRNYLSLPYFKEYDGRFIKY